MNFNPCIICSEPRTPYRIPLCIKCVEKLRNALRPRQSHIPSGNYFEIVSLFDYSKEVGELITQLKFQNSSNLMIWDLLTSLCSYLDPQCLEDADSLVPIPGNFVRTLSQLDLALCLGISLSRTHEIPLDKEALRQLNLLKTQQKDLNASQRQSQISGHHSLFKVSRSALNPDHSSVVIVDDVCTSGGTLLSAKEELEKAGIKVKRAVVLASKI